MGPSSSNGPIVLGFGSAFVWSDSLNACSCDMPIVKTKEDSWVMNVQHRLRPLPFGACEMQTNTGEKLKQPDR